MPISKLVLLPSAFALALLSSCHYTEIGQRSNASPTTMAGSKSRHASPMPTVGPVDGLPTYGAPIPLPGTTTWLSSFQISKSNSIFRSKDSFAKGGLAAKYAQRSNQSSGAALLGMSVRWHDVLFTDRATEEHWTLLPSRGFIYHWWTLTSFQENGPENLRLAFAATTSDSNNDGLLNDRDASVAILTDYDGRNPRVVTPPNAQLIDIHHVPGRNSLRFELRFDANRDAVFKADEPVRMYYIQLDGSMTEAAPWHNPVYEEALEARYR